jgi:Coenzyme PQQ synthesis protein D (PqqD)
MRGVFLGIERGNGIGSTARFRTTFAGPATKARVSGASEKSEVSISADAVSRRLDNGVVVVNLKSNRIFSLNPTGARYWELLEAGAPREQIESKLADEFDVESSQLRREIAELEASLLDEGLVERA